MTEDLNFAQCCQRCTVAAYPSCERCLTWSEGGIAVAAGRSIYLLQKVPDSARNRHNDETAWATTVLRVDQFRHEEWSQQSLATIHELSIGEEQAESTVVALDWSQPGLGIHHRSVLAVLTSNLILSIWETNGSQGGWHRTAVVNHFLPKLNYSADVIEGNSRGRPTRRVRSFTWSKALFAPPHTRWGSQYLLVADDEDRIILFNVQKNIHEAYGSWSFLPLCTERILPQAAELGHTPNITSLQTIIQNRSPITRLQIGEWYFVKASTSSNPEQLVTRALVSCQRTHDLETTTLLVEVQDASKGTFLSSSSKSADAGSSLLVSQPIPPYPLLAFSEGGKFTHSTGLVSQWRREIDRLCTEFDQKNLLRGLFRIRFWGSAFSPDNNVECTCITLHPWDTYEYTSPVHEKCYVIFRSHHAVPPATADVRLSDEEVVASILRLIRELIKSTMLRLSIMDRRLMRRFITWSLITEFGNVDGNELSLKLASYDESRATSSATSSAYVQASIVPTSKDAQTFFAGHNLKDEEETCEICRSVIPMTASTSSAVCNMGHPFARCNISLLAIQEPGISKYCSVCERQFLSVSKLDPPGDHSLVARIFDAFDTCPYCGGSFSG